MNFATLVSESRAQVVSRVPVVVLRIYLGVVFLYASWPKLTGEGGFAARLAAVVERTLSSGNAHGFYEGFLDNVVAPNAGLFATLVVVGEFLVAVALITGTATRIAAGVVMFMVLNYMFLKGAWFWHPSSNDAAFFVIGLVLIIGAAGRAFGVDYYLSKRWPKARIW